MSPAKELAETLIAKMDGTKIPKRAIVYVVVAIPEEVLVAPVGDIGFDTCMQSNGCPAGVNPTKLLVALMQSSPEACK